MNTQKKYLAVAGLQHTIETCLISSSSSNQVVQEIREGTTNEF